MLSDKLELKIRGVVKFRRFDHGGRLRRVTLYHNAIQAQAKEIVAKRLIENVTSKIDVIEIYNGVTLLASKPITGYSIVNPTEVEFDAVFDGPSFNSNFTEARLKASGLGNFSILAGLADSKDGTQSILVSWNIKIV